MLLIFKRCRFFSIKNDVGVSQNGTQELLPPKELYCVLGCHDALNRYFQRLKGTIITKNITRLYRDIILSSLDNIY